MSEGSYLPPPPPAPPRPPSSAQMPSGFDFAKPFTFVFEDPAWVTKLLIGGLFMIASVFLVGIFFILGYCAQLTRNVVAGLQHPLPEWDNLGDYFGEGLRIFGVLLVYSLPIVVIVGIAMVPVIIAGGFEQDEAEEFAGMAIGCVWCLTVPLSIAMLLWLPAVLLRVVMTQSFGGGFEFGEIFRFISANFGNYLLAILIYIVARFIGGFGMILLCIGVFFTAFWAYLVETYAFAQVWKLAHRK
jgi:Protein of unknown function (DUF4013)